MTASVRPLLALLANPNAREVVAKILLGSNLDDALEAVPASKSRKIRQSVLDSGLVSNDTHVLNEALFRELLAADAPKKATGVERFLRDGRIEMYPANLDERGELLAWVADKAFGTAPDAEWTEPEVNEHLAAFHDDVAVLRRYLVDYGVLTRSPDGTRYSRPTPAAP